LTRKPNVWRDLAIAFAGVGVCTAIRLLLRPQLDSQDVFTTYFPAVMLAGLVAGIRAMLAALVTSGLIVWWTFIPPPDSFALKTREDVAALCTFFGASGLVGAIAVYLRRTLVRLWESEERQRLVAEELNHRVKNALSQALALATLTAPKSEEMKAFLADFADRLNAIARANTLLAHNSLVATDLNALLKVELGSLGDRVEIHGPQLQVEARAATSISMIVHELATNSMKYGALSGQGQVEVAWRTLDGAAGSRAALTWIETGGPAVSPPSRTGASGFGSKLIGRLAEKELGGAAELDFRPNGLHAEIEFPASAPTPAPIH
jgi:two-component sensor histidine kinase